MQAVGEDLWTLIWGRPHIDPQQLLAAIEAQAAESALDFRTRLLIRDAINAVRAQYGEDRIGSWLAASPYRERIEAICNSELGEAGFPSLRARVMEPTRSETVEQYLREIGSAVRSPTRLVVGGSMRSS